MKKLHKILLLTLIPFLLFIVSCRKDAFTEELVTHSKSKSGKQLTSISEKQAIKDWLIDHDRNLNIKDKKTLELVSNNLNYDDISVESRNNGEHIFIIPIKEKAKEHLKLQESYLKIDESSTLNLIIVQSKEGKLRWSSIVSFHPFDGKKKAKLSDGTVQNILNNKPVIDEGIFKFLSLNGKVYLQLGYKKGRISSVGSPIAKDQLLKMKDFKFIEKKNNQPLLKDAPAPGGEGECTDWYLVITYYDGMGGYYNEWEYLYTSCDGEDGGSGGGIEEDPEIEIQTSEASTSTFNESDDLDIATSGPNTLAPSTGGTVIVRHEAEVWRKYNRVNSTITVIYPKYPTIIAGAVSDLYFNAFLQKSVIRKATLLSVDWWVTYLGKAATVTWRYSIHYKYHASPYINEVWTRQVECPPHVQAITAWDIGHVSW